MKTTKHISVVLDAGNPKAVNTGIIIIRISDISLQILSLIWSQVFLISFLLKQKYIFHVDYHKCFFVIHAAHNNITLSFSDMLRIIILL